MEFPLPYAAPGLPATDLEVGIFDLGGRRVATPARGPKSAADGVVSLRWEATNGHAGAKPGVYFVLVSAQSAGYKAEKRIAVIP